MIFLYLIAVFISLFILYGVGRHDFVLIRQSISLRNVFDKAFIALFIFFITSRIFYILQHSVYDFFSPLKFLYLTRHWGLLPYAGIIFAIITIFFLFRKKKNKLRILDIYLISLTPIAILDILLWGNGGILLAIKSVAVIVLLFFYGWFIAIHNKFTTKDGFITGMIVVTYTLTTLALSVAQNGVYIQKYLFFNLSLITITVITSVFIILIQKGILNKQ